ncbi:MAG: hypothetical protein JW881_05600 [Spirochaetales bacterium]|nr:hypothetical protein [Spirochaetales bacterium]
MATFLHGDEQEKRFLNVLKDLEQYRETIVLIGGWLPFIYINYLWKLKEDVFVVKTVDIDFALHERYKPFSPLILDKLMKSGDYMTEPVYEGEAAPFDIWALYGDGNEKKMRLDFLSHEFADPALFQKKILGAGVNLIPLETVEFMLKESHRQEVAIPAGKTGIRYNILKPSAYFFVKGISFANRSTNESDYKYIKDMWSLYFVLDTIPLREKKTFLSELTEYKKEEKEYYDYFIANIREYFTGNEPKGLDDLTGFLKTVFPEQVVKKRIVKMFGELHGYLEGDR